ncbi:2-amino-4-hydroxy-6-hydroxymethyldihydropteridine diphosphokinase [Flavobacterium faecale]|uniref:2-amino-4-hydroxy-6- hydroxymethyldihydropteridine diphosphokinase n=1 Tax=Flavobacterium faecale TaxID=1355330 RepID=UPI003AAB7A64
MNLEQKVILSLGTNQGDKLGNILFCIQLIKEQIGEVTQVSKLYETPSWGFESDAFYNCALEVATIQSPLEVLKKALSIEQEMGRVRQQQIGYQSRIIDIDLIFYGEQVIHTEELQIPHPLMQDRKFVLMPILDLNIQWKHPVLNKTIESLVGNCKDSSECLVVQDIDFV